jgi:uncharacterized membrane protein
LDLYGSVVFVHAATILLFFIAHGTSMAVAFKLKAETDPTRVRALVELSRFALDVPATVFVILGLLSGIVAGFMGDHWGSLWIWISIVLFVAVAIAMTPMATKPMGQIRAAAGGAPRPKDGGEPPPADPERMRQLIEGWRPLPVAAMGLAGFLVILWLMYAKPF